MAGFSPEIQTSGSVILPDSGGRNRLPLLLCLLLAGMVWLVFGQTLQFGFVNYDDDDYVYENSLVSKGLSFHGVAQALTERELGLWTPSTTLSHMLDSQLYGLRPGGHHLGNVLIHLASVLCLFLILHRLTGTVWRSFFVAALFAVHPLHVESVAWISERKDVLSGLFFMLTLGAYLHYVRREGSFIRYGVLIVLFGLGLMAKPMLVTVPGLLLLLDYWPLKRLIIPGEKGPVVYWPAVREKIPLLALSAALSLSILWGPKEQSPVALIPFATRLAEMPVAFVAYFGQMFWPADLAVIYPRPETNLLATVVSLLLVSAVALAVFLFRKRRPYLLVGWLWNMGMMIPVSGILQISRHWQADHYTYLPQIGIYLMVAWGIADLSEGWPWRRMILGVAGTAVLLALILAARAQTEYWRNSTSLWTHALACTVGTQVAHNNLGAALFENGDIDGAIEHYEKALILDPSYAAAHYNIGNALRRRGKTEEAIAQYQKALELRPNFEKALGNLGNTLLGEGKVEEAIRQYRKALEIKPGYVEAWSNLGTALLQEGRVEEAVGQYRKALELAPKSPEIHLNLAAALLKEENTGESIEQYKKALEIRPEDAPARFDLGNLLLQEGRVDEAVTNFESVLQIQPRNAEAHNNLAIALCQKGRIAEAAGHYQKVLEFTPGHAEVQGNLAWILATAPQASLRDGAEAVRLARQSMDALGKDNPMALRTLAAAYAEAGNYREAVEFAKKSLVLAKAEPDAILVKRLEKELGLYRAGLPFRDPLLQEN